VHGGPVQPGAIFGHERRQLTGAGRLGRRARLGHRGGELVGEGADGVLEAGEARGGGQRVQLCAPDRVGQEQPPLDVADDRAGLATAAQHLLEQVVERPHAAADEHSAPTHELALNRFDVGPVGDDQERVGAGVRRLQEAVEQEGDLAAVGRAEDELERHQVILRVGTSRPILTPSTCMPRREASF
jgi:hypothetical protein